MNTQILQKCVDELKKETFSKEYVLGMLETIIAMSGLPTSLNPVVKMPASRPIPGMDVEGPKADEEVSDAAKRYLGSTNVGTLTETTQP